MDKRRKPIDGVVHRQRRGTISDFSAPTGRRKANSSPDKKADNSTRANKPLGFNPTTPRTNAPSPNKRFVSAQFAEQPDGVEPGKKANFWQRRRAKKILKAQRRAQESKRRRMTRRAAKLTAVALLLFSAFFGYRFWWGISSVIDRAGKGALALQQGLDPTKLKGEGDGRINVLLMGMGGEGHPGGELTDTMIVASVDPFAKEMAMLSIPRDMYVKIPGYGSSRVNAAHSTGEEQDYPGGGAALARKTIEQTLDIPIHYYVRADFTGFEKAVNAVGGITFNVTNPVVNDYNFSSEFNGPFNVPTGKQTFDGKRALFYLRSRYSSPRGDFDRNQRQRDVLLALKDKVLSVGTFSDPRKVNGLIGAVGNHVRTDLQLSEMMRMYEIMETIPKSKVISVGLDNGADNYLRSASINGASVLVPKAGQGDYSEIQKFVRGLFVDGFIRSEKASVDVLNGSSKPGIATSAAENLRSYGYNVVIIGDAPMSDMTKTVIYDHSKGKKPYTKQYLEKRFKVKMKTGALPAGVASSSDFVIILGANAATTTQN